MMADSNSAASMALSELVSYSATISTTTSSGLGRSPIWGRSGRANAEALAVTIAIVPMVTIFDFMILLVFGFSKSAVQTGCFGAASFYWCMFQ
jgi:hypothetical protein